MKTYRLIIQNDFLSLKFRKKSPTWVTKRTFNNRFLFAGYSSLLIKYISSLLRLFFEEPASFSPSLVQMKWFCHPPGKMMAFQTTTQVWTVWVYLYADFFPLNAVGPLWLWVSHLRIQPTGDRNYCFRFVVGWMHGCRRLTAWMQRVDCMH